jgi:tetratricopeptide (TPR) repeat protein
MEHAHHIAFGPFRFDVTHGRLYREEQVIGLRPRCLAVLCYLVEHPGRLVTKAELWQHVWAGTHVTDTVLRASVKEIRAALGDVAAAGDRQLVFVSGEVGVGKTTVIDLWLARLAAGSEVRMAWGQCVEHYGEGEPYLPLLGALGQLCREAEGHAIPAVLRRYAPLWLAQLPGLVGELEQERLQRQLRELAEALDVLAAERPLVLVLEDLHWSDTSTVEVLAYLAQRREPVRLLVLGTYRPVETMLREHPLRRTVQELCGRGQGAELRLECLPAEDVAAYMAGRLGGPVAAQLAAYVHARTEGNALFMVNIVDHLVQQRLMVRREGQWALRAGADAKLANVPEGLQQFLVRRIEDLPPDARRALEATSVAGEAFAVAAVAAGAQCPVTEVDAVCEGLARQQHFIDDTGLTVWPDATSGGSYRFRHALYQQVLYEQVGTARRVQLHRRIGARLEAGYGARAGEIAAQLAVHFERGGEIRRAVHYWQQAGENAARRHAYHEAIDAFRKGLALLATLPEDPERTQRELALQLTLGELWGAVKGRMAPEVGEAYTRAYALCQQVGETPWRFEALWGLTLFHCVEAQLSTARRFSPELFDLAERQHDGVLLQRSHYAWGMYAFAQGNFGAARAHLEDSRRLSDTSQPSTPIVHAVYDEGMNALCFLAQTLWVLGYADQAQQRSQEALAMARQGVSPPTLANAQVFAAMLCQ